MLQKYAFSPHVIISLGNPNHQFRFVTAEGIDKLFLCETHGMSDFAVECKLYLECLIVCMMGNPSIELGCQLFHIRNCVENQLNGGPATLGAPLMPFVPIKDEDRKIVKVYGMSDCDLYGIMAQATLECRKEANDGGWLVEGGTTHSISVEWLGLRPCHLMGFHTVAEFNSCRLLTALDNLKIQRLLNRYYGRRYDSLISSPERIAELNFWTRKGHAEAVMMEQYFRFLCTSILTGGGVVPLVLPPLPNPGAAAAIPPILFARITAPLE